MGDEEAPSVLLTPEQARRIREGIFLLDLPNAAMSMLFLLQLQKNRDQRLLNTHVIADEVRCLEGVGRSTMTKPASQFTREPLRGLWHKHFMDARFMLKNIGNHWRLGQGGELLEKMLEEEFAAEESGYFTDELAARISHRLVMGGYTDRAGQGDLTGEWIVFKKHESRRFYLTLASHTEGDDAIYKRILEWCLPEFPFLFEE